jgi:hypothetical protein
VGVAKASAINLWLYCASFTVILYPLNWFLTC